MDSGHDGGLIVSNGEGCNWDGITRVYSGEGGGEGGGVLTVGVVLMGMLLVVMK